jgi:hypothetical protein
MLLAGYRDGDKNVAAKPTSRVRFSVIALWCVLSTISLYAATARPLLLTGGNVRIEVAPSPSDAEQFAAAELARYLQQITTRQFGVEAVPRAKAMSIVVGRRAVSAIDPTILSPALVDDGFVLRRVGDRVLIAGRTDRATLYGVYAFLERMGCRWFAPNYDFYGAAKGEYVPRRAVLAIGDLNSVERPAFKWRKLYIEEGRSHTSENLVQMVDWMAKARMNVLDCPVDYQHHGHTKWDHWRDALIPELRKRGLLIEVGGHGYQTYLPQDKYFDKHPEWFGLYDGKRSREDYEVFATSNEDAVHTLIANIETYLEAHPEIDIFDLWPPDGARWSEAKEDTALGTPAERQVLLLNQVARELRSKFKRLNIQFIAYQNYVSPPLANKPADGILMEFCPINRSFESALYENASSQNEEYFRDLESWRNGVINPSSITIYSYITKYAWRSLPIVVPHLIVNEVRRYRDMGIGGFATYSEPGNWATFEVDHYITARALWNPDMDVAQELSDYADIRYGPAGTFVLKYLELLEEVVPHAVAIPGTTLDATKQKTMMERFQGAPQLLAEARKADAGNPAMAVLLAKLDHQYDYVENEMSLQMLLLERAQRQPTKLYSKLDDLLQERKRIIQADPNDGVILQEGSPSMEF